MGEKIMKVVIKSIEDFINAKNNLVEYEDMIFADKTPQDEPLGEAIFNYFNKNKRVSLENLDCLGYCYIYGIGTKINRDKGQKLCYKAGKKGYQNGLYDYAVAEFKKIIRKTAKMEEAFLKIADAGHKGAQCYLGMCYCLLEIFTYDKTIGFKYLQMAVDQNYAPAQYWLGYCYYNGKRTKQDFDKAFELFTKSAQQGYTPAEHYVALCYKEGKGVKQDLQKANELLESSAKNGNRESQNQITQELFNTAETYFYGRGVEQDYKKAV